jgi:hypothetical protein
MIKFFRKIRQKLLSENKFSKYLIYAIGEILLVVIGILIALSINNWNQDRENRVLEQYYLQRIIQDLETDINEINSVVKRGFGQVSTAVSILNVMNVNTKEYISNLNKGPQNFTLAALEEFPRDTEALKASGKTFGRAQYGLWAGQEVDITFSTFNELLNNGKLDVISNLDIREKIIDHYNKILEIFDIQEHITESRQNHRSFLLSQNIPAIHSMKLENFMESLKDKKGYETILKNYIWGVSFGTEPFRNIISLNTEELIKEIESYLEEL